LSSLSLGNFPGSLFVGALLGTVEEQGDPAGDDVLEIGPGPGVTTDLLRTLVPRLTTLEVDADSAAALQQRLDGSGVRVVHGQGLSERRTN
jgi:16S rRNA A1518/A1519 N6-dimethyltransferase RsmA/KsgA/DIM1 with predicted DNA glycosylase/AP lyase activity